MQMDLTSNIFGKYGTSHTAAALGIPAYFRLHGRSQELYLPSRAASRRGFSFFSSSMSLEKWFDCGISWGINGVAILYYNLYNVHGNTRRRHHWNAEVIWWQIEMTQTADKSESKPKIVDLITVVRVRILRSLHASRYPEHNNTTYIVHIVSNSVWLCLHTNGSTTSDGDDGDGGGCGCGIWKPRKTHLFN